MEQQIDNVIELAEGKRFLLVKRGRAQAAQLQEILRWLAKYGKDIAGKLANDKGEIEFTNLFDLIDKLSEILTPDALLELFVVVIGCSKKEAEEYFDLGYLITALEVMFGHPTYRRVFNRFFSTK